MCGNSPNSAWAPPTISPTPFESHFSTDTGLGDESIAKGNAEIVVVKGLEYSSHSVIKLLLLFFFLLI